MSEPVHAICVAIDEFITATTIKIEDDNLVEIIERQEYDFDRKNIALHLIAAFSRCADASRNVIGSLDTIDYIAVSSIGIINNRSARIESVARPTWRESDDFPIRLDLLIATAIPDLRPNFFAEGHLEVINDCTACVIGERFDGWKPNADPVLATAFEDAFAYVRVGEGVNVGIIMRHLPWRGGLHPEMGHIIAPQRRHVAEMRDANFSGICPVHGDCLEGTISMPALLARFEKKSLNDVWDSYPSALENVAADIAYLSSIITMMLAPRAIFLGGSVIDNEIIYKVRDRFEELIGSYPDYSALDDLSQFLVPASLGSNANIRGLMRLAQRRRPNKIDHLSK